jgi:dihydropteroate synthase
MGLDLQSAQKCLIMGVMNITPDSFSDGGKLNSLELALTRAERMISDGVDILDVGGESTRPGAAPVELNEELDRVIPVIECIKSNFDIPVSVDTSKAEVMRSAAQVGVDMLNDVSAFSDPKALRVVAESQLPVCVMHMQGEPRTMQEKPMYDDVVQEVATFLSVVIKKCIAAGIESNKVIIDPGLGFGKNLEHNLKLLAAVPQLKMLGHPVLIGGSKKSLIGHLLQREIDERMPASIALAAQAALNGAAIVRVHDVKETYDAVRMVEAVARYQKI